MSIRDALSQHMHTNITYNDMLEMGITVKMIHDWYAYQLIPPITQQKSIRQQLINLYPLWDITEDWL